MPPPTGVVSGPLMATRNSRMALTVSSGSQFLKLGLGFFAGENFVPGDRALAVVGLFNGGVEHAHGGFPDVAAGAVAFNEGNDGVVGHVVLAVAVLDLLPVGWDGNSIERRHATCLQRRKVGNHYRLAKERRNSTGDHSDE